MRLRDQVCLVTGAASGIGRGIAQRFRAEGGRLVVADRNGPGVAAVARELDGFSVAVDVADSSSVDRMVRTALDAHGRIDVVVNSAGIGRLASALETTDEDWHEHLAINLTGTFFVCRRAPSSRPPRGDRRRTSP